MQVRFKWHQQDKNLMEGLPVLLKDENLPPFKRSLATIRKAVPKM